MIKWFLCFSTDLKNQVKLLQETSYVHSCCQIVTIAKQTKLEKKG